MKHKLAFSLGPILFFWPKKQVLSFYQKMIDQPLDTIYLGESICSNRQEICFDDWFCLARDIACTGKKVVFSSQVLLSSESDLRRLRQLVEQDVFKVEANDMGAVKLARDQGLTFVAGSTLNIYNEQTLNFFRKLGAVRWVPPVEMPAAKLQAILATSPAIDCEVFGWGRLPLAFSSRCFTAHYYNRSKEQCDFKCQDHPDAMTTKSVDGKSHLAINGTQTLSAKHSSLLAYHQQIATQGVKLLRLSPQYQYMTEVIQIHHAVIHQQLELVKALEQLRALVGNELIDGYWHGLAGNISVSEKFYSPC